MNRRTKPSWSWVIASLVALFFALGGPRVAGAAPNDREAEELVSGVLESEFNNRQYKEALEKLDLAKQACEGKGCSPKVRAKVFVAIGTVLAAGLKQDDLARQAIANALNEDPNAAPFPNYTTPEVERAFKDARAVPAQEKRAETPAAGKRRPKHACPPGGRAPRGWRSPEAACYYRQAVEAEAARDWSDCAANAQASMAAESRPTTRMLAGICEERGGSWLEALADYQAVVEAAPAQGLFDVAMQAKQHAQQLRDKIPKLVLRKPPNAEQLRVVLDGAPVAADKLGGEIWINPGQHAVHATGSVNGVALEFDDAVEVAEFETTTVDIQLGPKGAKADTALMKCMLAAKTREDFQKCIKSGGSETSLNVRMGAELSGYHDSDHVDVVTPAIGANVESPTGGWGVGATFLVDVVTAASVDIVATASPRWTEVRYAPGLSGHKKFGDADASVHGSLSHEPDYLAVAAGAGASLDLAQKTVTPSLGYEFGYDISGRAGTSFDVFSRKITRHAFDAATTFVVDKATIFGVDFTAVLESGDTSKPYRYIPMFSPKLTDGNLGNGEVQPGQTVDSVNLGREPERVLEQLPTERQRWALAGRIAHRFTATTLRVEERLYVDSWGLKATTTDAKYLVDISKDFRAWPHLRFHAQAPVDFWELAYTVRRDGNGNVVVPSLRTGDRELGPLIGVTVGGGARFAFGERRNWAITATADVIYTRFLDDLFISQRTGYFGALATEVSFE